MALRRPPSDRRPRDDGDAERETREIPDPPKGADVDTREPDDGLSPATILREGIRTLLGRSPEVPTNHPEPDIELPEDRDAGDRPDDSTTSDLAGRVARTDRTRPDELIDPRSGATIEVPSTERTELRPRVEAPETPVVGVTPSMGVADGDGTSAPVPSPAGTDGSGGGGTAPNGDGAPTNTDGRVEPVDPETAAAARAFLDGRGVDHSKMTDDEAAAAAAELGHDEVFEQPARDFLRGEGQTDADDIDDAEVARRIDAEANRVIVDEPLDDLLRAEGFDPGTMSDDDKRAAIDEIVERQQRGDDQAGQAAPAAEPEAKATPDIARPVPDGANDDVILTSADEALDGLQQRNQPARPGPDPGDVDAVEQPTEVPTPPDDDQLARPVDGEGQVQGDPRPETTAARSSGLIGTGATDPVDDADSARLARLSVRSGSESGATDDVAPPAAIGDDPATPTASDGGEATDAPSIEPAEASEPTASRFAAATTAAPVSAADAAPESGPTIDDAVRAQLESDVDRDGLSEAQERVLTGTDPGSRDSDGDGLTDFEELRITGTDPTLADSDGDGLSDGEEWFRGRTHPLDADQDDDGLLDGEEVALGTDPTSVDTDEDGLSDFAELAHGTDPRNDDSDGDFLLDGEEVRQFGTDPTTAHTDTDGIDDFTEVTITKTDPTNRDTDGDGISDADEAILGADPNTFDPDTDGDGVNDAVEKATGTDPLAKDSDGDGLSDGEEFSGPTRGTDPDTDNDGLNDADELRLGTDPRRRDTDGDGVADGIEVHVDGTDPLVAGGEANPTTPAPGTIARDRDGDGLSDAEELELGTDPSLADTDGDGVDDAQEFALLLDPLSAHSDSDDLTDGEELKLGTDPRRFDTDGDGMRDSFEVRRGFDPLDPDQDRDGQVDGRDADPTDPDFDDDGILDGDERLPTEIDRDNDGLADRLETSVFANTDPTNPDTDGDGVLDGEEFRLGGHIAEDGRHVNRNIGPSDPNDPDSVPGGFGHDRDGDGLDDFYEREYYGTDPTRADTDGDGLDDRDEVRLGTKPRDRDTDNDGVDDGTEVALGRDPLAADFAARPDATPVSPIGSSGERLLEQGIIAPAARSEAAVDDPPTAVEPEEPIAAATPSGTDASSDPTTTSAGTPPRSVPVGDATLIAATGAESIGTADPDTGDPRSARVREAAEPSDATSPDAPPEPPPTASDDPRLARRAGEPGITVVDDPTLLLAEPVDPPAEPTGEEPAPLDEVEDPGAIEPTADEAPAQVSAPGEADDDGPSDVEGTNPTGAADAPGGLDPAGRDLTANTVQPPPPTEPPPRFLRADPTSTADPLSTDPLTATPVEDEPAPATDDASDPPEPVDPALIDTDGDGITDRGEARLGTDATRADTDGDGRDDLTEIQLGTDPLTADGLDATPLPPPTDDTAATFDDTAAIPDADAGVDGPGEVAETVEDPTLTPPLEGGGTDPDPVGGDPDPSAPEGGLDPDLQPDPTPDTPPEQLDPLLAAVVQDDVIETFEDPALAPPPPEGGLDPDLQPDPTPDTPPEQLDPLLAAVIQDDVIEQIGPSPRPTHQGPPPVDDAPLDPLPEG